MADAVQTLSTLAGVTLGSFGGVVGMVIGGVAGNKVGGVLSSALNKTNISNQKINIEEIKSRTEEAKKAINSAYIIAEQDYVDIKTILAKTNDPRFYTRDVAKENIKKLDTLIESLAALNNSITTINAAINNGDIEKYNQGLTNIEINNKLTSLMNIANRINKYAENESTEYIYPGYPQRKAQTVQGNIGALDAINYVHDVSGVGDDGLSRYFYRYVTRYYDESTNKTTIKYDLYKVKYFDKSKLGNLANYTSTTGENATGTEADLTNLENMFKQMGVQIPY